MLGQKIEVISIKADLYKDGDGFRAHLDVAASAGCLDAVAHERDLITSIRIAKQQLLWQAESQHLGQ